MGNRIHLNEARLKKIVSEAIKKVLNEEYNADGMLIIRQTTPKEFNEAKRNGEVEVHGEYNGYAIIKWDDRWYYLDTETGDLCDPTIVHKEAVEKENDLNEARLKRIIKEAVQTAIQQQGQQPQNSQGQSSQTDINTQVQQYLAKRREYMAKNHPNSEEAAWYRQEQLEKQRQQNWEQNKQLRIQNIRNSFYEYWRPKGLSDAEIEGHIKKELSRQGLL